MYHQHLNHRLTSTLVLLSLSLLICGCGSSEPASRQDDGVTSTPSDSAGPSSPSAKTTEQEAVVLEELPSPEGENGKFSIAQVMQLVHENKLYRKLYKVPLDPQVAERVTLMYDGLADQSPPVGEADDWKARVTALRDAAAAIIEDSQATEVDKEKLRAFQKSVSCNSCHNRFTTDRGN